MKPIDYKDLVAAIRDHALVGAGSCTVVDECLDDADLIDGMQEGGITTPQRAIAWAIWLEDLHMEQGLNTRYGDDDDPQLAMHREWQERSAPYRKAMKAWRP